MIDRKRILKRVAAGFLILLAMIVGAGSVVLYKLFRPASGEKSGSASGSVTGTLADILTTMQNPEQEFPGQSRVNVLCMGIDDNWTDKDQVYTRAARSDTLFILSLDIPNKRAAMLSIPRDTYAHIAGTHWNFKVNAAYQTGGPQRAIATVDELLGVRCDHYMVLNIDATKKMVDALGGVDVNVEHEMHYHDNWGHLNIDLMPGVQHLNGEQAVGFARYRHPDAGKKATPEDGDERRTYRQHVLFKAMATKAKTFGNVIQVNTLMDVAMSCVATDLSRPQLLALAAIYHGVQQDDIRTATLPGEGYQDKKGLWFFRLYPNKAKAYVDWLIRGDEAGARRLTPVVVKNGSGVPRLAAMAVAVLRSHGYTDVRNGGNATPLATLASNTDTGSAVTEVVDSGVADPDAAVEVATSLGLTGAHTDRRPNQPNRRGWVAPAVVTVVLGRDYVAVAPATMPDIPHDEDQASGSGDESGDIASPETAGTDTGPTVPDDTNESPYSTTDPAQATGETAIPQQDPSVRSPDPIPR